VIEVVDVSQKEVLQVIQALNSLVSEDTSNANAKEIVALMYDTAMLTSGFDVESPKDYANKVYDMMGMALSGEIEAPAPPATAVRHQVFC
jgi:HSP90 family molecular chaperone